MMIRAPTKPIKTETQRRRPTFSFKINGASAVTKSGAVYIIALASANWTVLRPVKKHKVAPSRNRERNNWNGRLAVLTNVLNFGARTIIKIRTWKKYRPQTTCMVG